MCICLIQFQHNSYPCNTLRTLAYGYMRYKLGVWLKITGVSISIIFHKIDSREKLHRQDQNPLQDRTGEKSPTHTCTHTHTHTTALCRSDRAPYSPGELPQLQQFWPLGSQLVLLALTWHQSSKVRGSHLWCLNQRTVQSSRNLESELGSNHIHHCLTLGNFYLSWKLPWRIILKAEKMI